MALTPPNDLTEGKPTGAVMVVGGGIAGMQASLDLADTGFKVYLIEKESAIGGKMAQLDKTFPTNDCAMCTISPKLVEVGRHPNIEVLTNSEVFDLTGRVGNFTARVRQAPRYIDIDKCVSCGDCTDVCPVLIPDLFNELLVDRHAAYKQYPQAVPNAYAIEKAGIAPCRDACPSGQRAQGYIALIREGRWEDALRVIKMDNPFPGICGRICNHRCEEACNRAKVDQAINIRALKRFVTDKVYEQPRTPVEPVDITHPDRRVAVIGAGPCGLTAAQDIIHEGYPVTVFEAMPVPGGMLRLGVPEYRLPTEIIEREVQDIIDLGVDLRLNHRVDDLDSLFEKGYQAVLIAVGAHEGVKLPIPGANLDGVLINTRFLRDVRLGKYEGEAAADVPPLGDRVIVLGGGNVAIDCARTAVRLGKEVHLACLEDRDQMPAHAWEIAGAEEEGVHIHAGRSFERILGDEHGHVRGLECSRVESFHFDDSGGLHVQKEEHSQHIIPGDTIIFSVGQRAGLAFIPDDAGVGITENQTIAINPNTLAATREGVFAAGDSVSGTTFVIEAVDSGHTVARSIIRYLKGKHLEPPPEPNLPVVDLADEEIQERLARGEIRHEPRVPMPELPVEDRVNNFSEIERGYDEESARLEAARCLACGICSECMSCVFECDRDAIDHDMVAGERELDIGGVILAPGFQIYHAELSQEYGFGRYPNVVTSLQFERLLSASGPTMGHVKRPSDDREPRRVAFLQCIGSRDQDHDYCSAVCCMYATKEAMIAKEHHPDLEIHVFMMDMRAFSKSYWRYFQRARDQFGVHYHRSRVSALHEDPRTHNLILHYTTEGDPQQRVKDEFDMVVLSVGMEISDSVKTLGRQLGIALDEYGFCHTPNFDPVESSRPGIYAVGPFREPKDIPESVVEASGAAGAIASTLAPSRFTLTTTPEFPPEKDVSGENPRVGVFVCHCGSNIGGFLDVPGVAEYARELDHVAHAEDNLYTCAQDSIKHITETVKEKDLNRVVVASCTPLTHQPLFQDSIRAAGLNPYLFEMANIRNQCSWVHSHDWEEATSKARDLVRMAVSRAAHLQGQDTLDVPVSPAGLVVGGGAAGMTAALTLAESGFPVHLVERDTSLGGSLREAYIPQDGRHPQDILASLIQRVNKNERITVHLESEVVSSSGFKGNFTSELRNIKGEQISVEHGATILATGAEEYTGPDYGYGQNARIVTQREFEHMLAGKRGFPGNIPPRSVVMIQCVGPADQYCSRICCTNALQNALFLKDLHPDADVAILHKDIRTYGFKERLYTRARQQGVVFQRYHDQHPPEVRFPPETDETGQGPLEVQTWDAHLGRTLHIHPDLIVLSMPAVPHQDASGLATLFKVSTDEDGFFMEAHVKLRPVDFSTEGVFMAGMAHYPKLLEETLVQAQAAAARAARVLSQESLAAGGRVAEVDPLKCTGCLTCVRICPFEVPVIQPDRAGVGEIMGAAYIEPAVCQGCGSCAAECPAHAIQLHHYTDQQMRSKVQALVAPQALVSPDPGPHGDQP